MANKPKRADIQGLRTVAILGVLLFHLAPKKFVNGFLGVDIFFVLSGYLMTSILAREATLSGTVVSSFYARRFNRIVPLYSIMLAALAVLTPLVFLPSDLSHFITDLEWALPFAENMQNVLKKYDYWDEVFNSPVLLHAWSLGVELQYYLVVPLIMSVARFGDTRRFRLGCFAALIAASFCLHALSPPAVAFGLLLSRVWQFLTGSCTYELEQALDDPRRQEYQAVDLEKLLSRGEEDEEEADGNDFEMDIEVGPLKSGRPSGSRVDFLYAPLIVFLSYSVTGFLCWMVVGSSSAPTISRVLVTLATGCALLLGKFTQNAALSNDISVYLGDLSYVVYLAHWPVIVLYKYANDLADLSVPDMSFCILATLAVSVLLHHSLERFFISASSLVAFLFVAALYTAIVLAIASGGLRSISERAHPPLDEGSHSTTLPSPTSPTTFLPSTADSSSLASSAYSEGATALPTLAPPITTTSSAMPTTLKPLREFSRVEAVRWNLLESKVVYFSNPENCVRDYEAEGWTNFREEYQLRCLAKSNGTAKILVMGNSYAYRAFPVLHRLLAGRYAQLRLFTRSTRVYLSPDPEPTTFYAAERTVVENFRPDLTFLIEKDSFETLLKPIVGGKVEEDPITKHLLDAVAHLSVHSGRVLVDRQYYKPNRLKDGVAYIMQKRLQQGRDNLDDLRVARKDYEREFANERARMAAVKRENVRVNDVQSQLCPPGEEFCYFYDRDTRHSYYGDHAYHLTSEGLRRLEPAYTAVIEDFLKQHELEKKRS